MRILLLNDGAAPVGGAELQSLRLRDLLRAEGHDVRLLASTASAGGAQTSADAHCYGTTHPKLRVLTQTVNLSAALAVRREVERFRPDVVHVRMFLTQLSPLILPALRTVPVVWQIVFYKAICPRGTKILPDGSPCRVSAGRACLEHRCVTPRSWVLDMLQQRLRRRWADAIDAVVTLSETSRAILEAEGIVVDDVIPNGIRRRPARPPLTGPPTVAFAGRLVPEKGADVLLRAFASLDGSGAEARLLIAGDGPELSRLRQLAGELGINERTAFLGRRDRDELERRFEPAWIQVVPGRWAEPLGNVTLEAMMRGTAVVASDAGGPAETVVDGETGVLVEPGSVPALADALSRLLTDRERCERLGAAGRARAVAEYGEDRVVERLEEIYAGLRAKPRRTNGTRRSG